MLIMPPDPYETVAAVPRNTDRARGDRPVRYGTADVGRSPAEEKERREDEARRGPYCFGADVYICRFTDDLPIGGQASATLCQWVTNGACLTLAVMGLGAILAVGLSALLE